MDCSKTKKIQKLNNDSVLSFIKEITSENIKIRFFTKPELVDLLDITESVEQIHNFVKKSFQIIFTKGFDRLFRLVNYITSSNIFNAKSNNCKTLIISQFIIINQVFGDGNHRTAMYILQNYSTYTLDEIRIIMNITERIHYYAGDLKYLWIGIDGNLLPDFDKLYDNAEISTLLKK